jgi:hypothetical protein
MASEEVQSFSTALVSTMVPYARDALSSTQTQRRSTGV